MDVSTRSADWLAEVVDLMREPSTTMPVPTLLVLLRRAFGVATLGWAWFDADGSFGMVMDPPELPQNEQETLDLWRTGELFDAHALMKWYQLTGDVRPQTIERVPSQVLSKRRRLPLDRLMVGMEMEHQLSIIYRLNGLMQRAFIIARGRSDFSDDDLAVARVVQRSLAALDHQVTAVQRLTGARTGADMGLTGRELAVLQLISEGATTRRVARALVCSPRTVEKHLENVYRRLGVQDRLNAVRVLQVSGVLGTAPLPDHQMVVGQGAYCGRDRRPAARSAGGLDVEGHREMSTARATPAPG